MAIKVFDGTDNTFSTNGEIVLNPTRAIVHKEDNGSFYLDLETPLTQETKYVAPEEGSSATINGNGQIQNVDSTKESELVSLKGDTYQYTTTGKNLFDINGTLYSGVITKYNNGFTLTNNGTYRVLCMLLPKTLPSGTYKFTSNIVNTTLSNINQLGIQVRTSSSNVKTFYINSSGEATFTTTSEADRMYFFINSSETSGATITLDNVMLSISGGDYEPYTNGASPNPDYPQNIDVATGNQIVDIHGKNYFDKNNVRDGYRFGSTGDYYADTPYCATEFIAVQPNTTYYRNITIAQTKSVCTYDQNQTFIARLQSGNSFTTPSNCYYIRTSILITEKDSCQLEKGSTGTIYEPYKGKTYDINLGKNLYNYTINQSSSNRLTSVVFSVEPNTTYTFSTSASNIQVINYYKDINKNNISNNNWATLNYTFTTPSNCYYIQQLLRKSDNADLTLSDITNLQLEKGSQATSYSEYFTPIELNKISTYKDYIFKGKGINLCSSELVRKVVTNTSLVDSTTRICTEDFIAVKPNTTYTLSFNTNTNINNINISSFTTNDFPRTSESGWTTNYTFTTGSNIKYVMITFRNSSDNTITLDNISNVMLNEGTSALPYEPYNAKDKWLLHKEIGKVVLNGSESWSYQSNVYAYYSQKNDIKRFTDYRGKMFCNYFQIAKGIGAGQTETSITAYSNTETQYPGQNWLYIRYDDMANASALKTWLSTHNTIVYYVLANPTTTEIDNSELVSELNNIELIGGLNNISLSSSYLTGEIDLKYNFVSGGETTAKYIDYLQANNILVANTPQGNQAFRISNVERTRSKIRLKANHIFYDTQNYVISDSYVVEKNCNQALDHLNDATDNTSPFSMTSDITTLNSYRCVRKSLYEAIQVVLERWGGHLVRDNFDIKVMSSIGNDNGVVVRYGKNLKNISATYNWDAVATKLMPVGKDGLLLPEEYLYASVQYDIPYTKVISFDQNNIVEDDYADADAYQQALVDDLRQKGMEYLASNSIPMVNYTLNANLERITDIGDTIEVIDERLGINLLTNLISYEYNCILDKYTQVQFGNFTPKLQNLMETIASNTEKAIEENNGVIQITLENELTEATDRIWGVLGNSYVIYEGDKILVVDELPKENAHNVIMINSGGIGFSQTGINGTFQSAWTIDNTLNMENINVINLTADLIKGGILKLGSNLNQYGQIEIYNEANNLIAELNKNGFKMYGTDGSYVLMNTQVGFAGYDRNDNKIYWADGDAFHMKKSEVEEEITLCGKMRYIPIHLTDTYGVEHNGIGLVSVLGGGN